MHFPCSGLHRIPVGEKLFCQVRRELIGRGEECKERRCNVVHLASGKRWKRSAATRLFKAQETSAGGPSCLCGSLNFLHWCWLPSPWCRVARICLRCPTRSTWHETSTSSCRISIGDGRCSASSYSVLSSQIWRTRCCCAAAVRRLFRR